jgi:hypothetical protein
MMYVYHILLSDYYLLQYRYYCIGGANIRPVGMVQFWRLNYIHGV